MNYLILCLLICFYFTLSNQLELPPTQSLFIIDNIFSNYISQKIISDNLTSTLTDHLPQFLTAPHIFSNAPNKKSNIFQ